MKLTGRWALVTGAGRGIGRGCAVELARNGADLVLNDRPDSDDLPGVRKEIEALGRTCHVIRSDVFSRRGCESLVSGSLEAAGRLDILISNPACNLRSGFLTCDPDDFARVIDAALMGGFHVSQLVARHMADRGAGGKIVFISSVHAALPYAKSIAYNAAKAGLNHMVRTIAVELAKHRINVNAIEPGWIDTPGERKAFGEERLQQEGAKLPWGRIGTPGDIGKAAAFLASDDADYVTGSILRVDGGFLHKDCVEEI